MQPVASVRDQSFSGNEKRLRVQITKTELASSHACFMIDVWIVSWMRVLLDGWPCGLMGGLVDGWIEGYGAETLPQMRRATSSKY